MWLIALYTPSDVGKVMFLFSFKRKLFQAHYSSTQVVNLCSLTVITLKRKDLFAPSFTINAFFSTTVCSNIESPSWNKCTSLIPLHPWVPTYHPIFFWGGGFILSFDKIIMRHCTWYVIDMLFYLMSIILWCSYNDICLMGENTESSGKFPNFWSVKKLKVLPMPALPV